MFLANGVMWSPQYKITINKENKTLLLRMDSLFLSNENCNLGIMQEIYCVVGYPNMSYSNLDAILDDRDVESTLKQFTDIFSKLNENKTKNNNNNNNNLRSKNISFGQERFRSIKKEKKSSILFNTINNQPQQEQ